MEAIQYPHCLGAVGLRVRSRAVTSAFAARATPDWEYRRGRNARFLRIASLNASSKAVGGRACVRPRASAYVVTRSAGFSILG